MPCDRMETGGGASLREESVWSWVDTWGLRSLGGKIGFGSGGQKWGHQHKNINGIQGGGWD